MSPHIHLKRRYTALFFGISLIIYTMMTYGGLRSSDSEVVFRTAESLVIRKSWAVEEELPWPDFGLREGKDGKRYAWFGPGEIVANTPLLGLARSLNKTRWYERFPDLIPLSHYIDEGLRFYLTGTRPQNIEPHAVRFLVSFFNVFISAGSVALFFLIITALTQSLVSACYVTVLFAFGSLAFPYSGTFLSEPLTTLLVLFSFYCLLHNQLRNHTSENSVSIVLLLSGLFLGAATTTHVTTILFVPFWVLYAIYPSLQQKALARGIIIPGISFSLGLLIPLVLLGYYNYIRFGDILETGRTADPNMITAGFIAPWNGLKGLLISGGKGLFWFNPAILLSFICWRSFHKKWPIVSIVIGSTVFFRIGIIASWSGWHGGFCLGPRFLVVIIPFLLLPLGSVLDDWLRNGHKRRLWMFIGYLFLCISQQIYFCVGEIFSFLHVIKLNGLSQGFNVFTDDFLYVNWDYSPLLFLLDGRRGPFLLSSLPVSNYTLWGILTGITALLLCWMHLHILETYQAKEE